MANLSSFKSFSKYIRFFQIGVGILLIILLGLALGDPGFFKAAFDSAYVPQQRPLFLLFVSDYLFLVVLLYAAFQLHRILKEILQEKQVFGLEHIKGMQRIGWALAIYTVLQFALRSFAMIELKSMMGEVPFDGPLIATILMELRVDLALLSFLILVMGAVFRSGFQIQKEHEHTV